MFKQMDLKGKVKDDTKLSTTHQNAISTIRVYESQGSTVTKFSCTCFPVFHLRFFLTRSLSNFWM